MKSETKPFKAGIGSAYRPPAKASGTEPRPEPVPGTPQRNDSQTSPADAMASGAADNAGIDASDLEEADKSAAMARVSVDRPVQGR